MLQITGEMNTDWGQVTDPPQSQHAPKGCVLLLAKQEMTYHVTGIFSHLYSGVRFLTDTLACIYSNYASLGTEVYIGDKNQKYFNKLFKD